jgi:hypothetical protein
MLTKVTKTVEVEEYYLNGQGPYESENAALEAGVLEHCNYNGEISICYFLNDKELLIALGEWAKENA